MANKAGAAIWESVASHRINFWLYELECVVENVIYIHFLESFYYSRFSIHRSRRTVKTKKPTKMLSSTSNSNKFEMGVGHKCCFLDTKSEQSLTIQKLLINVKCNCKIQKKRCIEVKLSNGLFSSKLSNTFRDSKPAQFKMQARTDKINYSNHSCKSVKADIKINNKRTLLTVDSVNTLNFHEFSEFHEFLCNLKAFQSLRWVSFPYTK